MLSREENELLTRIGPDTPMGRTMRRYWLSIADYSTVHARAETVLTEGERWQDLVPGNTARPARGRPGRRQSF